MLICGCFCGQSDATKLAVENNSAVQYHVRDPRDGSVHSVAGSGNGYRPAGGDVYFAKDQRESINFGREPLEPGEEPPYANFWPQEASPGADSNGVKPGWRSTVLAHQHQMLDLSARLRRLIALALGAPPDAFEPFFTRPTFQTGMVYYHPAVSDPGQAVFAIRPHADGGIFTILANDGEPGLHICPGKGVPAAERVWIPVPPRANSLVVNLGGELERWSNGRFKATLHCVVNETGRERFSLPFFFEPNLDAAVEPLPCTGEPQERWASGPISPAQKLLRGLGLLEPEAKVETAVGEYFHKSEAAMFTTDDEKAKL